MNGARCTWQVTRLYKLPVLSSTFPIIHDVAEPQMMNRRSPAAVPQRFQNSPKAMRKSDRAVANQGNSSKNTTRFPCGDRTTSSRASTDSRRENASNQSRGMVCTSSPHSCNLWLNDFSCRRVFPPSTPVARNAKHCAKVCSTRYVFPTRRRPYTQTSSDFPERSQRSSSRFSAILPIILIARP